MSKMGGHTQLGIVIVFAIFRITYSQNGTAAMDVVLLIDSSEASRSQSFDYERKFAVDFVNQIFTSDVQFGLYTFGEWVFEHFALNKHSYLPYIDQVVQNMWVGNGNGVLASALQTVIDTGFSTSTGDRECAPNVLVVVTHTSVNGTMAKEFHDHLQSKNIRVVVLNMAGATDDINLAVMANDSSMVFPISNFTELEDSVPHVVEKIRKDVTSTGCGKFTDWGNWSTCSVTCGNGMQFRRRSCAKIEATDKDCEGALSDGMVCKMPNCTDPVDGMWTNWGSWSQCTKTCEAGSQQRERRCNRPPPLNGGKDCPGKRTMSRKCSEWKCPDCNKTCPNGAHLSKDCATCECSSVTIFGQIMDSTKQPVDDAKIYFESSRYKPIAQTNRLGQFMKSGICILNEQIYIEANNCEGKHFSPVELNATHWTLQNTTLEKYVAPIITIQPEDKIRMVGQSLSLCCKATGKPIPSSYKWFKHGIEIENVGTNGTLSFTSTSLADAGIYNCYTETAAGVTLSEEIKIDIHANGVDTCTSPKSKLQTLPHGCHLTGDTTLNSTIDVGDCGKAVCVKSSFKDNGSCSDYWPHHCCNVKDIEVLNVSCERFTYQTTRVRSCECKPCVFKTTVSGRAIGMKNGSEIPLQFGDIIVNGKVTTQTNAGGFFKFDVSKGKKRVVAIFRDELFETFMDITKVFKISPGTETFISVVIPLRPVPINFHADNGTEIHLGGDNEGIPPAGRVSIPSDALVDSTGNPYKGQAKATFHFMDPRKRDDIEAANGVFESESPSGEKMPLKTFGMFQLAVHDDGGNELKMTKPLKFTLNASLFNVPYDDDGNPDVSLWTYDNNKGIWVENVKLHYAKAVNGRKKRELDDQDLIAELHPSNMKIPDDVEHFGVKYVRPIVGYTNCDHSVPIYGPPQGIKDDQPKDGACLVSVSVYKDQDLREAYDQKDIEIKTYVKELNGNSFISKYFASGEDIVDGHACIPVFCDKLVYIQVIRNGKEVFFTGKHSLPFPNYIRGTKNNEIEFESRDLGRSMFGCPGNNFKDIEKCEGPMYQLLSGKSKCEAVTTDTKSFQFKFAPFTRASVRNLVEGDGVYDKKMSWYPVSPVLNTFRSCFLKVRVDIQNTFDLRLLATSYLGNTTEQFGTYEVGLIPNPRNTNHTVRGACIEFRCPGYILDGGKSVYDIDTRVEVYLKTANKKMNCSISNISNGLPISPKTDPITGVVDGFVFVAESGENYGSDYGVFVNNKRDTEVEKFCACGHDNGPNVDSIMNPSLNAAVAFTCSD